MAIILVVRYLHNAYAHLILSRDSSVQIDAQFRYFKRQTITGDSYDSVTRVKYLGL